MDTEKKRGKWLVSVTLFLAVMGLTLYTVLHGQDLGKIGEALRRLPLTCLLSAMVLALFYVCAEGFMIWYLLRSINGAKSGLLRCISYSFIGFFYSGITPSATGGQPVQLYYMKKDGNFLSDSSVVLMTVALLYKLVLVLLGSVMLLCWFTHLQHYLGKFLGLYLLGLFLNLALVFLLLAVMLAPKRMQGLILWVVRRLEKWGILKRKQGRDMAVCKFVEGYREAVQFLIKNKGKVFVTFLVTILQRSSVFLLTVFVYKGFSQSGTALGTIWLLQASVSVAADMLPLPGAQGISELMYEGIFADVFAAEYLMPSLYVTRGICFYFLLAVSLAVTVGNRLLRSRRSYFRILTRND